MSEKLRFQSEEELTEIETAEKLKVGGGISYERITDQETGEEKNFLNIFGVKIETYASAEEVEEIKETIILSKLDQRLLRRIAECYSLKQALLFEGDPGAGKTFLFKKFVKLVHGKDAPIQEIVGTPRTSELEILGHWAPKGMNEEEAGQYQNLLQNFLMSESGKGISTEFNATLDELNKELAGGNITAEEFHNKFGSLTHEYINQQRTQLVGFFQATTLLKPGTQWEFKEGALLRAYSGNGGRGYPLIVDEFNIIPTNYQQIFLQIGGEQGSLSDSISFWGNSGKTIYKRGEDTWIAFASNFPEKTPGRSEVVAPMSDRLVWQVLPDEEYQEKKQAIKRTAGGRLSKRKQELVTSESPFLQVPVERGLEWDSVLDERLGEQLADLVDVLDTEFAKYYAQVGDSISIQGDKRRRTQQMEFSGRNALRLFSYLDRFQVRNSETGTVDFVATLKNAYEMYYLSRLADPQARDKMAKLFNEIVEGDTGKIKVKLDLSLKEALERLAENKDIESELKTRKEVIEQLVSQVGIEQVEKEGHEQVTISVEGPTKDLLETVAAGIRASVAGKTIETAEYEQVVSKVVQEIVNVPTLNEQDALMKEQLQQSLGRIFSKQGNLLIVNLGDGKGGLSRKHAMIFSDATDARRKGLIPNTTLKVVSHIGDRSEGAPVDQVLGIIMPALQLENIEMVKLVENELLAERARTLKSSLREKVESVIGVNDTDELARMQRALDEFMQMLKSTQAKIELREVEDAQIPRLKKSGDFVILDEGPIKAAMERVGEFLVQKDVLYINLESTSWNQDSQRSEFVTRGEFSTKLPLIKKILDAGVTEPIILTGFLSEEHIKKTNPEFEEILKYPNVHFFRQPIKLGEVLKAIYAEEKES